MSFDLAFWHSPQPASAAEAQRIYVGLCEQNGAAATPTPKIAEFIAAVVQKYPQIDDWPEDDIDSCPWSIAFDQSPGGVVICMVWSVGDEVVNFLLEQASRCGLVAYDPQSDACRLPS